MREKEYSQVLHNKQKLEKTSLWNQSTSDAHYRTINRNGSIRNEREITSESDICKQTVAAKTLKHNSWRGKKKQYLKPHATRSCSVKNIPHCVDVVFRRFGTRGFPVHIPDKNAWKYIRLNGATLVNGRSGNWQCGRNSASVEAERKAADETRD